MPAVMPSCSIRPVPTGGGHDVGIQPRGRSSRASTLALVLAWILPLGWISAEDSPPPRKEFAITEKDRAHWAFQPVRAEAPPRGPAHPVDAFIEAELQRHGLRPASRASRRSLIRRACYDLTGLPPSPEEVEAFDKDSRPDAWERLIERLLASPHYGEKWGRHWLDLVRFAESNSYERDGTKPNAWRYRDYVIRSLNADLPYDRFIREQLAGDELPRQNDDPLIATGFYRLGVWDDEPVDREVARYDALDDIVTTTGQVFLGLTVDCARCHNHKIDPIGQRDYYRLLSFFNNIAPYKNGGPSDEAELFADASERQTHQERVAALERQRSEAAARVKEFESRIEMELAREAASRGGAAKAEAGSYTDDAARRALGEEAFLRYAESRTNLAALQARSIPVERALVVTEAEGGPPETHVLLRGNPNLKGDRVEPGFIEVLGSPEPSLPKLESKSPTCGRRSVLANWIASPGNPLTARVMVNRIWQHHFGRGIVGSPNNFGLGGEKPTHPALLDWLASEFIHRGWSLKSMHRLLMTSEAYQRSSRGDPEQARVDPSGGLLGRFPMRRLTAEEIRDTLLVVTGTLNPKMFGPGVYVEIPQEVLAGQSIPGNGWGKSPPEEQARRSLYIFSKRSLIPPILENFDVAETDRSSPARFTTVQPTQALGLLNSEFLQQEAGLLAERLRRECPKGTADLRVARALSLATARTPSRHEVERGVGLITSLQSREGVSADEALRYFCLVVLNLNELIYVD